MMDSPTQQQEFADRLRSLRLAAELTIEQASELAGLSPGFWGDVERNVKEPCLNSLYGFASTFNMTVSALLAADECFASSDECKGLVTLIHLLEPDQLQLAQRVLQLIYDFRPRPRSE
jgi:transcriptional regulator with XRE-family HTH domain